MRGFSRALLRVVAPAVFAFVIALARSARADLPSCEWLLLQEKEKEKTRNETPQNEAAPSNVCPPPLDSEDSRKNPLKSVVLFNGCANKAFGDAKWDEAINYFSQVLKVCSSAFVDYELAQTLEKSKRFDEAVEAYQRAAREPRKGLDGKPIGMERIIDDLLKKVAVLHIEINVDALLYVDKHPRGVTGNHRDLYLMPGKHTLEFVRSEYKTVEQIIDTAKDKSISVDLQPATGALRVEEENPESGQAGASVFVDGVPVGTAPWEGIVEAGPHVVWIRRGDTGSFPTQKIVGAARTEFTSLRARPLGPVMIIDTSSPAATIKIDGVVVGRGRWQNRLPISEKPVEIVVEQEGYQTQRRSFVVAPGSVPVRFQLILTPKLAPIPLGSPVVTAFASLLYGGNAGNRARGVTPCGSFCSAGFWGGARVEYRMLRGISIGAQAGYGLLYTSSEMDFDLRYTVPVGGRNLHYKVTDRLRTQGPFIGVVGSYERRLGQAVTFVARPSFGLLFASSDDAMRGEACADQETCSPVGTSPLSTRSAPKGFLGTEIGAQFRAGKVWIDAAVGVLAFPAQGPTLERRQIGALAHDCDPGNIDAPGCAPNQWIDAPGGAPSRGPFLLGTVSVAATYVF